MPAEPRPGPQLGTWDIVLAGLLGALLFASKAVLAFLPNIEPVSLLVMAYASVLGWRALYPIYVYAALEYMAWGFGLWSACYLYVWTILALAAILLRRMEPPVGWALLSGAFGLCFGALCAPAYWASGGWQFALAWWVQGIPSDLLHCAGNFAMALFLFRPCRHALSRLMGAVPGRTR